MRNAMWGFKDETIEREVYIGQLVVESRLLDQRIQMLRQHGKIQLNRRPRRVLQ